MVHSFSHKGAAGIKKLLWTLEGTHVVVARATGTLRVLFHFFQFSVIFSSYVVYSVCNMFRKIQEVAQSDKMKRLT